ncbi:MAG TPA: cyclopropane-fatty-acyl-phospholipid synthase family protein [Pirellulaceae bacterium]|nr:cyclopropane-fatty-acyl-phospholipid synthase family protein [Pirellulaceae bacterium]
MREWITRAAVELMERGWIPDVAIRAGIRSLLRQRLRQQRRVERGQTSGLSSDAFLQLAVEGELALETDKANEQHYEVPASFFNLVLGPRKKYSCCWFDHPDDDLATAEERALEITCQHAELADGMEILELGCGWGSLTLRMLEHYSTSRVVAVSNSHSQREYIERAAAKRGLADRLQVLTRDIRDLELDRQFDRVVSVEMFEHVRNHRRLLERISSWLRHDGLLFVHIFCHRQYAYPFETEGAANWMGKHFFTGGMMPHQNLFRQMDEHLVQTKEWVWDGTHYERTCRWWIANMHRHREPLLPILENIYGPGQGPKWFQRWKIFFWACAELFGYREGREWFVGHYQFRNQSRRRRESCNDQPQAPFSTQVAS